MGPALFTLILALTPAWGQEDEEEEGLGLLDLDMDIDLSDDSKSVTFQGDFSQRAADAAKNQTIKITHNGGNITVRCSDTPEIVSRVVYTVDGQDEASARAFGGGVKMSTNKSWINVITPYKGSKIRRAEVNLTVTVPTDAVVTANTTGGWVQAIGCNGYVTISAGKGGAYADGELDGFRINARDGDAKVVVSDGKISQNSSITASRGKVDLEWPAGQSARISAKGSDVSIGEAFEGQKTDTSINGTLGEGGPSLTINAGNEVRIKAN